MIQVDPFHRSESGVPVAAGPPPDTWSSTPPTAVQASDELQDTEVRLL